MRLADSVGLKIPSGCRTGLCGSCTARVYVPGWEPTGEGESNDWQLIRCCSAGAVPIVNGELVVDLRGTPSIKLSVSGRGKAESTDDSADDSSSYLVFDANESEDDNDDPLSRFSQNWENEYVPDYLNDGGENARSAMIVDDSIGVQGKLVAPWEYISGGDGRRARPARERASYKEEEEEEVGAERREIKKKIKQSRDSDDEKAVYKFEKYGANVAPWDKVW